MANSLLVLPVLAGERYALTMRTARAGTKQFNANTGVWAEIK